MMKQMVWAGMLGALALAGTPPTRGQAVVREDHLANAVSSPLLVTATATNVVTLFSTNASRTAGRVLLRTVQNVGTVPVLYLIGSTNVSATNYHGVLAGGAAARDGLGSLLDLSRAPWPVSFQCESNSTVLCGVELTQ